VKLLRYGPVGRERPGIIDSNGLIRDLSPLVSDLTPEYLSASRLAGLAAIRPESLEAVSGTPRLGTPYTGTQKFIAIGLNYSDHAAETGQAVPVEPVVFTKANSCIVGPNDDVMLPRDSLKTDWEVELGVVIGREARYVDESNALRFVAGYCVVNDVSERAYQFERGGTWDKGKGCDTFGPIGPFLVTADEVTDPQNLDLWLDVNGRRMQSGNTRTMIFTVAKIVSYLSQFMTLVPGDLITTGTPPGVGFGQKPNPIYLKPGDSIDLGIGHLGKQRQRVVPWSQNAPSASG
jgi:2,4-didehydro-3-deoxy-L-rhamnonate hydrolase